jgi:hypothetical protein
MGQVENVAIDDTTIVARRLLRIGRWVLDAAELPQGGVELAGDAEEIGGAASRSTWPTWGSDRTPTPPVGMLFQGLICFYCLNPKRCCYIPRL